jgi:hypothetical protein
MRMTECMTLRASKAAVWRTFVAVERWPEWSPWKVHFDEQPRLKVGTQFLLTLPMPWMPLITLRFPCRVTALENPSLICWAGKVLGVSGYHRFTMQDVPGGCQLFSEEVFEGRLALLLWPVRRIIKGRADEFLWRLKARVEAASPHGLTVSNH